MISQDQSGAPIELAHLERELCVELRQPRGVNPDTRGRMEAGRPGKTPGESKGAFYLGYH